MARSMMRSPFGAMGTGVSVMAPFRHRPLRVGEFLAGDLSVAVRVDFSERLGRAGLCFRDGYREVPVVVMAPARPGGETGQGEQSKGDGRLHGHSCWFPGGYTHGVEKPVARQAGS
jgi:hypothetical protein